MIIQRLFSLKEFEMVMEFNFLSNSGSQCFIINDLQLRIIYLYLYFYLFVYYLFLFAIHCTYGLKNVLKKLVKKIINNIIYNV